MKRKSIIISGALALSLLTAPATSLASTGDSQGYQAEQKDSHVEKAFEWISQNEDLLKVNNSQNIDLQSLFDQLQQGHQNTEQPAPAEEQPEAEQPEAPVEQPADQQPTQKEQQTTEAPQEQPAEEETTEEQPTEEATQEETNTEQAETSSEVSAFEQQVVELTNEERAKEGLAPLKLDTELSGVAKDKSLDMQQNGYFSHNSPTYGSPFDMMNEYGIDYTTAGENIARGQTSPEQVVEGWMNSEGHRKNIMNSSFTHIGVGHAENGNYWTQMFIAK
ncbi:CAP domain-containing protein [Halobacillus seohaensis]|uniref:CAP domain-containing protein n=1 Tax=Halobacillus seohaensis TaxID=447421 RepID=A0ABW2EQT4_9BACI